MEGRNHAARIVCWANSLIVLALFFSVALVSSAQAQNLTVPGAEDAAQKTKQHIEKIMGKYKGAESRAKGIAERAVQDSKAKTYTVGGRSIQGAREHPWKSNDGNNPSSEVDYIRDSLDIQDGKRFPRQLYSCWEPQLNAYGWWNQNGNRGPYLRAAPGLFLEALACKLSCPDVNPYFWQWPLSPPWKDPISPPSTYTMHDDNGFELIQYWWPEHVAYTTNYGINPLDPTQQSAKGARYGRSSLLGAEQDPERQTKDAYKQNYKIDELKQVEKLESIRQEPFKGQTSWYGFSAAAIESTDDLEVHGARTRVAYRTADQRPDGIDGWIRAKEKSIYDSFPPRSSEKDIINAWTESGKWSVLSHIPQTSYEAGARGQRAMNALFGPKEEMIKAAKKKQPFWKTQGAAAYRAQKWPEYQGLTKLFEIKGTSSRILQEVVYKGGHELFPLTTNISGFTTPLMTSNIIIARRGFYMMGTKDLLSYHTDGEKGRMNEYTINVIDPSREVDKMQRKDHWRVQPVPSECFRTQIGAANFDQIQKDPWLMTNLPSDNDRYTMDDYDYKSFIYWNKRFVCTCRIEGHPHGAFVMEKIPDGLGPGRGSGDRPYGKIEPKLCSYQINKAPSAFMGADAEPCVDSPGISVYRGLEDQV